MPKNWIFALFLAIVAIGLIGVPQAVSAQNKPAPPEAKEKVKECDDDDDDEDITAADRASIKVTLADAKKIALQRVPGKITDQELEKEHGRLQYAFEIHTAEGKEFDVEIDAITGEVLQAEPEDDDDDDGPTAKTVVKAKTVERVVKVERTVVVAKKPQ